MIRAALRSLHSPDAHDLESWVPEDPGCFGVFVQALIGPAGGEGEESFGFTVCSPSWFADNECSKGPTFGRHCLFLREYDYGAMRAAIARMAEGPRGETWGDVAEAIARFGRWEFEDFVE